jgi:hypothetical protein
MCLITTISRFTTRSVIHGRSCRTLENWSIIDLVNFNTCPSVEKVFNTASLLDRRETSASTFSKNSFILSTDSEMQDRIIFILTGTGLPFLSVRLKLASGLNRLQHDCSIR